MKKITIQLSSLPFPSQLASARLYSAMKTISLDALISLISEVYKCQQTQRLHWSGGNGKSKNTYKDEALSPTSGKLYGKKRFERKPWGACWNCGKKGHYKDKCPKPLKKKENSSKNGGAANTAIVYNFKDDGAFFMEPESEGDSGPSDFKGGCGDDKDWFLEVNEEEATSGMDTEELSRVNWSECGSLINIDLDSDAAKPNELAAQISAESIDALRTEIYDSSCSKHLTTYRDALKDCVKIPPKSFQAANKQSLAAARMGEMTINIPNGSQN